jgi:hypothetical protein
VLFRMLRGDGGENQSVYSMVQCLNHSGSNGSQPRYCNPQVGS